MTEETENYNGSADILGKLSDVLKDDKTISPKVGMRLMIEAMVHQIKEMHSIKKRIRVAEEDIKVIQKDGVKPTQKSAWQYFVFFIAIDRSGVIDLALDWLKREGAIWLKLLLG